ncbi:MAG TPA: translation initiation factor IF-2 [Gaiellaceae bacterium]|jgi:translation initiation factor IF-2|nr:translation initiation factor IF-2 [Gaiellaceae bacterium]
MADRPNKPNRPIRPRQGAPAGRRKRRVVIDTGAARPRQDGRQRRDQQEQKPKEKTPVAPLTGPVTVESGVTVKDLSQALGVPVPKLITILMGLGAAKTVTQSLADEEVQLIGTEVGREVNIKHAADEELEPEVYEDDEADLTARPPVVTIMGHVDHGKTTLLDAIRQTAVVETEAGGITQHIGAYQVVHGDREITFLDTPGHEAFTAMRARGAKVTDIAVLVVAADDGVMPQTKESIAHARAAEVPIVVAVNKIDLPDANADRVRTELAAEDLQPEEWGGSTQFALVSAKQGEGLDDLLEKVLLVADAELELTANPKAEASGPIVESRLDVGRGPVATMLVHRGTLRVGDAIVAGDAWGKVRALYNFKGEKVKDATPGDPVEILGFDHPPPGGEYAKVVENERAARGFAQTRGERLRREQFATQRSSGVTLETLFDALQEGAVQDLNLVLKGDVVGSVEAAISELAKIQHPEVRVTVIHQGVGGITENDIMLASASNAMVVGFNVRPNAEARQLADREGVEIRTYRVIYQLTEDIEQALVGMLKPLTEERTLGEVEVRQLFRVSRLGTIAGSYVTSGQVRRNASVRVVRDGTVIYETRIAQLKRFKDDVREVEEGFECGILLEGFNDIKEGDVLEVYETRQVERTDLETPAPTTAA